ncbi:DegT/DnrJ/EryC1/StrS family aminotransferase [Methylobacterium goesingense]|uniref:dTDP-4-amino-4,6-dideoxygalactose transaminase n=1 Tax=Methylobacterium goesingense TaxID=243690 RepID=A0ABV2L8W5_9HYPH|nr:UDP-4-amino-4-deoxy-L-arabinose--oxoglutarate aminotransferase [Methylobacterium goesingense]
METVSARAPAASDPAPLEPTRESRRLLVAEPCLGLGEMTALAEVIDGGWITMGERVRAFERAFAEMHGTEDAVAVSSCTAGLHLIMHALGLGPGDEVLVPSLTFVATANCVRYVGATPVFVDIASTELPLMSVADAAAKCTPRTRAVILVHFAGYLIDPEPWRAFAAERGLVLVEDAAHAAGLPGVGTLGAAAAFSFYGNKNMTTAEGGMVVARDPALREAVRQARGHGLTTGTFQRLNSRTPTYDVTMLGFNYRMDELRAAMGLVQLSHLSEWNETRRALTRRYRSLLRAECPEVSLPFEDARPSVHHIMPVLLPANADRQAVIDALAERGVQTTIHYPPVHRLSFYRAQDSAPDLPTTEAFADRELTLPLHPRMNQHDVRRVVTALREALAP